MSDRARKGSSVLPRGKLQSSLEHGCTIGRTTRTPLPGIAYETIRRELVAGIDRRELEVCSEMPGSCEPEAGWREEEAANSSEHLRRHDNMSDQVASPYIQAVQVSSVSSASEYHLHTDNSVSNATLSTAPTEEDNTVEDSPIDVAFKWDLGYSTNIDVLEDAYWSQQQQQQQQRVSRDYSLIQDLIRAANEPKQHLDCPSLWTKAAHSGRSSYTRIEQSVQSNQFAYPSTLENIDSTSVEEGMEH